MERFLIVIHIASHPGTEALLHNHYIRSLNDPVSLSRRAEQQDPSNHDLPSNTRQRATMT
jgi:hypothetical protein